jgi:hypothetical protein
MAARVVVRAEETGKEYPCVRNAAGDWQCGRCEKGDLSRAAGPDSAGRRVLHVLLREGHRAAPGAARPPALAHRADRLALMAAPLIRQLL